MICNRSAVKRDNGSPPYRDTHLTSDTKPQGCDFYLRDRLLSCGIEAFWATTVYREHTSRHHPARFGVSGRIRTSVVAGPFLWSRTRTPAEAPRGVEPRYGPNRTDMERVARSPYPLF